jgi:glyoxylase-like metal-dependent hydrolase (beta-lactamase superfamily II)/rhodanese-related sulfurtransferase
MTNRFRTGLLLPLIPLAFFQASAIAQNEAITNGLQLLEVANEEIRNINVLELAEQLEANPDTYLIDVRTPSEIDFLGGTVKSRNNLVIPRGWLEFRVPQQVLDKDTPIVVYCGINHRSPLAAKTLMAMGYTNVSNMWEGFFAWRDAGLPVRISDMAPDSVLYRKPQQVTKNVWSAIGATLPPTYANAGHNNNLSFVITDGGVLVVNAGANYLLAQALHNEIKALTDQPVKYVVLENGQGHAALGSKYWREQGVPIIAHVDAAHILEENAFGILERMQSYSRDKAYLSEVVLPDETFEDKMVIELGGERIELLNLGPAHSPGDISVWLPDQKLVIAGDMAFHQRLLPVFEETDTAAWLKSWENFAALGAEIVIPGHGVPTDMAVVTKYTKDYLVYLRGQIQAVIDNDGDLNDAYVVDQSPYADLDTFRELAKRNAGMVFQAMQFE